MRIKRTVISTAISLAVLAAVGWGLVAFANPYDAARTGNLLAVQYYVKVRGGEINNSPLFPGFGSTAKTGVTMLHFAAMGGHRSVVSWLLDNGAHLEARTDLDQLTALHYAANYSRYETVSILADYGASIDALTKEGVTPLFLAIAPESLPGQHGRFQDRIVGDREKTIALLLALGADPKAMTSWGETTIMAAASQRDLPLIQRLRDLGVDLNAVTRGLRPKNAKSYVLESNRQDAEREQTEPLVLQWLEENMVESDSAAQR